MPSVRTAAISLVVLVALRGDARAESQDSGPRSERVAFALSTGSVIAGGALLLATTHLEPEGSIEVAALTSASVLLVVGPSAGHLYAGEPGHAAVTTLVRAGGGLAFVIGMSQLLEACRDRSCADDRYGVYLIGGGLTIWATGAVIDMLDAPRAARRANRRLAVQVVPALVGDTASRAPGLAIGGRF
jgi:hypothetical protein